MAGFLVSPIQKFRKLNTQPARAFNEPHSLAIRIWHWLLFILIAATITMVILATFGFRTGRNISLVQEQLQKKGGTIGVVRADAGRYPGMVSGMINGRKRSIVND